MNRPYLFISLLAIVVALRFVGSAAAQQVPDPNFKATVDKPAYTDGKGPKVLFDEGHFNVHTTTGSYATFTKLITSDGYQVAPTTKAFDASSLAGFNVLVISNARGEDRPTEKPAFTDAECDAVAAWVKGGGALLLVVDHYPTGHNNEMLAKRFGVDLSKGTTQDADFSPPGAGGPSTIKYSRASKNLADHPITNGRNDSEKLNSVVLFTGSSLKGPEGSTPLLTLSDKAVDVMPGDAGATAGGVGRRAMAGRVQGSNVNAPQKSAAGRTQGLAMTFGKGRVVVLGEASELSAQLIGPQKRPMGMNLPDCDNRQWAVNIMRWLSGLI